MEKCKHNFKTRSRSDKDPNVGRICKYCGKHVNQIRKEEDGKKKHNK